MKKSEPSVKLSKKMEKMKLYQLPRAVKVKIFPNGESSHKAVVVFAQHFNQVGFVHLNEYLLCVSWSNVEYLTWNTNSATGIRFPVCTR